MKQGSPEWHEWRSNGIGSSDAPAIMGVCPYRSREDVLADKLGTAAPVKENPAMRLGTKWEPAARAYFALNHGLLDIEPCEIEHKKHSFLRASLDFAHKPEFLFGEIKYMGEKKFEEVLRKQVTPENHWVQIQHQFMVTGFSTCVYVPYTLSEDHRRIERIAFVHVDCDLHYIRNKLFPALNNFWQTVTANKRSHNGEAQVDR